VSPSLAAALCCETGAIEGDLFSRAGICLPSTPQRVTASPKSDVIVSMYREHGRAWKVYSNLADVGDAEAHAPCGQFSLGLPVPPMKVTRIITPEHAMFMSATIRSYCGDSRLLENAARHLVGQDVLYLGDLTQMTRRELAFRLGRYRRLAEQFEERLTAVGLGFNATASWWNRPADYYARAY
jgi:hypothetical protein